MTDRWTDQAFAATEHLWQRIHDHPFVRELRDGTLPREKLRFYFEQNVHYIDAVLRCRGIVAAKAPTAGMRAFFTERSAVIVEEIEHQRELLTALGGRPDARLAPACHAYTRHLLTIAWSGEPVEYLGSFLPCPWSYDEIGKLLLGNLRQPEHLDWWEFYMSADHHTLCDRYRDFVDEHAEYLPPDRRAAMLTNFEISLRHEYAFWEMAYTQQQWD